MAYTQNNSKRNEDNMISENGNHLNDIKLLDVSPSGDSEPTGMCECEQHMFEVLKSFCSHTSLHGVQYVGEKSHIALRLLWAIVVLLAFGAAIYHICQVYSKWEETPATVTISPRVKDIQEVYFPAVTVCAPALLTEDFRKEFLNKSHYRYNERKNMVDLYCKKGGFASHEVRHVEDYLIWQKNTKLSCDVLMEDGRYPDGHGTWIGIVRSHVTPSQALVGGVPVECCTFNGLNDDLMYKNLNTTLENEKDDVNSQSPSKSQYLLTPTGIGTQNAFSYLIQNLHCLHENVQFRISIHHPSEAPNVEGDGLIVKPGGEISYTIKPLQTESTDNLKYLKPNDRGCQYYDDVHLRFFRNYTQWNCNLDCLANLTIDKCGCLPSYLPENNGTLKICKRASEFACFLRLQDNFELNGYDTCKCEQPCTDLMYLVTTQYVPAEKGDNNMVKFSVYFTEPTFFAYQRSELLGLSGFLASCGGLLGLFMGFSFISMIEIFYFGLFGMWKAIFGTFLMKINITK